MPDIREALEASFPNEEEEKKNEVVVEPSSELKSVIEESTTQAPDTSTGNEVQSTEVVGEKPEEKVEQTTEKKPDENTETSREDPKKEETLDETEREFRARVDRAPQSWKGETRKEWEKLPLGVRQEIVRRERDIDAALRAAAPHKEFYEGFAKVVSPYAGRFKAVGLDPISGIGRLLEADSKLASGSQEVKAQMVAELIQSYRIDLSVLDEVLSKNPQAAAAANPMVSAITEQVTRQLQPLIRQATPAPAPQRDYQAEEAQVNSQLAAMQQDTEQFPHFVDVANDMADLIEMYGQKGVAITLPEAYSKAVRLHPTIGPALEAKAVEQKAREKAEAAARSADEAAKRARAASSSLSGAPLVSGKSGIGDTSNLRSVLEQALNMSESGGGRV